MILNADALHIPLADKTVQTCVTSPPYYGLRDYGTAAWEGGDPECDHSPARKNGQENSTLQGGQATNGHKQEPYRDRCRKCGAIRIDKQIGLEETPEAYVEKIVQVFREVWRVMKDDGVLWLNLGDSYAGSWGNYGGQNRGNGTQREITTGSQINQKAYQDKSNWRPPTANNLDGCKPKDLIGIPWMVAFALRADGWYLRSDIIWHKPNPMPESVRDRPTKSHEYIFLLSKSQRYFYDAEAIKEPAAPSSIARWNQDVDNQAGSTCANGGAKTNGTMKAVGGPRSQRDSFKRSGNKNGQPDKPQKREERPEDTWDTATRNKRSVWEVATMPYSGAHFATFPPKLIEPCILAGSREGDIILDPFSGSGTTGQVAIQYRRQYVGLELNMEYIELSKVRTTTDVMLPNFLP